MVDTMTTGIGLSRISFSRNYAVHTRHFHIQRQHIRIERADHLACHQRIGCRPHRHHVRLAVDQFGEQAANERGIVHDQYPRALPCGALIHIPCKHRRSSFK